jgi:transglutaminase-like putative cysteine protease
VVLADSALRRPPATPRTATPPASSLRGGVVPVRPQRSGSSPAGRTWQRLGLYGIALMAAFASMGPLLQGGVWLTATFFVVLVPLLTIGIAKLVGRRPWQPVLAGLVVSVLLLTLVYAPLESLFAIVPTGDTVARWWSLVLEGGDSIASQRTPAIATDGIQFLLGILALACVVVIAPALDRAPALAALPVLVVLDIPVAVRAGLAEPQWYVVALLAYLALLRVGRRRMPTPSVVVTAAIVVVGSLVIPSILPPVRPVSQSQGSGFGAGLNPLINLGDDLRRGDPVVAATYTTTAPGGVYLRLATLDDFNGITWQPGGVETDGNNEVTDFPAPPGLAAEVPRNTFTVDVQVKDVSGHWLPVPYPAVSIEGLEGSWTYEADGLDVRSPSADARGQQYQVTFLDVQPDLAQLSADADAGPQSPSQYLDLPDDLPEIIRQTALDVTSGSTSTYEKALALQNYFTSDAFEYSIDTPVDAGYDGSGVGVVAEFLDVKTGYCVHFASAMAIMARSLGIPSRVAVGFQPGQRDALNHEETVYTVMSDDMHAWPELYFEGIGWLRFEPTPGRGALPDYSFPNAVDNPETPQNEADDPAVVPTVVPTNVAEGPTEAPIDGDEVVGGSAAPAGLLWLIPLTLVALLFLPAAARMVIRWRRMRRVADGDAEAAWAEIRDTAYDHDWVAPESETPRQLSERLAIVVGAGAVEQLQTGVESAAYDRPGSAVMTVQDVDALRHAISSAAAFRVRVRATLLPPSLLARFGFRTGPTRF